MILSKQISQENIQLDYFVYQSATILQQAPLLLDKEMMLPTVKSEIKHNVLYLKWVSEWDMTIKNSELNKIN
jgi:hypothetical protein